MDEIQVDTNELEATRLHQAGVTAAEQLKIAKQVVSDGGFAGAGAGPLLTAAVLQAIATNYLALTLKK
jgi:hypothetical protein